MDQYSLVAIKCKKWQDNESDPDNGEYELPILNYNANQKALLE